MHLDGEWTLPDDSYSYCQFIELLSYRVSNDSLLCYE